MSTFEMAEKYLYDRTDSLRTLASRPSPETLTAAALYIKAVLQGNNIPFCFIGVYSLNLRGSPSQTNDIDIAVSGNQLQLRTVLSQQNQIVMPLGPTADVMKIFVKTGGTFGPGLPEKLVEIDILIGGSFGLAQDLGPTIEIIETISSSGPDSFPVLGLTAALSSKLGTHVVREEEKDFNDIRWLCTRYPQAVYEIRGDLNMQHKQTFINACQRENARLGGEGFFRRMKHCLGVA